MKKRLILLFLFHSILGFCQDIFYLEGTIAKSKIYMKIEVYKSDNETSVNAVYFYQNSLKDIPLESSLTNDTYTLFFKPNDVTTEKFYLKKSVNNHFEGSWYNETGKQFTVQLQPVDFSNYKFKLDKYYADEKLNLVKCKFLEFKKHKTTVYKTKSLYGILRNTAILIFLD
jgi:hypothetical protein